MNYEYSNVEKDGKLWVITLNRPERMNALHSPAHFELEEIFNEFSTDPDAWVAIITGSGERAFCAGNDLRYQAEGGKLERNPMGFAGLTSRFDLKKPIIAAVNGVAMGGGFEIALACDLIIASENARFALPEPKVGLAALAGGMHRLPRQIGMKRAMGMMLTGRTVEAQEGLSLGFVNEVVAHQDLMESAKKWAESIMECSPTSVRTTKDVAMSGLSHASVETAMEQKYDSVVDLFKGEDFVEGPLAFSEKRKPNWTGK
jgi:crotonobetainyl-CoA hydratase